MNGGDPQLGPLGDNGGPTLTMMPASSGPLLDAVPADACGPGGVAAMALDQRGVTRPQGPACDIGAVEVVASPPAPVPLASTPVFTG